MQPSTVHSISIIMANLDYDSDLNLFLDTEGGTDSDLSLRLSSSEEESDDSITEETVSNDDRWIPGPNLRPTRKADFQGPTPGTTVDTPGSMREIDFFMLFFTSQILGIVVSQTNLYAEQRQSRSGADHSWVPVTLEELQAWIGMRVAMSVLQLPNIDLYWSEDSLFGGIRLANIMPRDRFIKIAQYLHVADDRTAIPRGRQGHDKLHKVRAILEMIRRRCLDIYNPHQNTSIDKAMVAFRGRLAFRQYMPGKPTKYGIKVWMRADPTNGYVNDFQVYTGKEGKAGEGGLGTRVVMDLVRPIQGLYHIVNCDNFFTSPILCKELGKILTYVRGTVRINRKDFPRNILIQSKLKKQGDMLLAQKGDMIAASWRDKKVVNFISTADGTDNLMTTVPRKKRDGTIHQVPGPSVVSNYNKNMNGVDRADQLRTELATYRTSRRWWQYLFWFIFDVAICNGLVLMRESANHQLTTRNNTKKQRTMVQFRIALAKQLIGQYCGSRKRKRLDNEDEAGKRHWPVVVDKRKRCRSCTKKNIRKDVLTICTGCGIGLCIPCFVPYHEQLML